MKSCPDRAGIQQQQLSWHVFDLDRDIDHSPSIVDIDILMNEPPLLENHHRLTAHGSRLTAHGSRLTSIGAIPAR